VYFQTRAASSLKFEDRPDWIGVETRLPPVQQPVVLGLLLLPPRAVLVVVVKISGFEPFEFPMRVVTAVVSLPDDSLFL